MRCPSYLRIASVVGVLVLAGGCSSSSPSAAPETTAAVPNPGLVFEGTYSFNSVQEVRDDLPPLDPAYENLIASVRSSCDGDTGPCTASATVSYPDIDPLPPPQTLVFDYADGKWFLNTSNASSCTVASGAALTASAWQTVSLEQSDGVSDGSVIAGEGSAYSTPPCNTRAQTTYKFTRTGPVDPSAPSSDVPPLAESDGAALSGTYDLLLTPVSTTGRSTIEPVSATGQFRTLCARTGDTCLSILDGTTVFPTLEWAAGTWTSVATYSPRECANGAGQDVTTIRASLTRTDSGAEPAQALSGELSKTVAGDCAAESVWSVTATRTGD